MYVTSKTTKQRIRQLETCNRTMFGDLVFTCQMPAADTEPKSLKCALNLSTVPTVRRSSTADYYGSNNKRYDENEKRRASYLVDQLLMDIYSNSNNGSECNSPITSKSLKYFSAVETDNFKTKDITELTSLVNYLTTEVERVGSILVRQLKRRDALRRQQDAHCDVITGQLLKQHVPMSRFFSSIKNPGTTDTDSMSQRGTGISTRGQDMCFTIQPAPGESGFSQWTAAMKMVAQLSGGTPPEFRRRLWLTLAEKHLATRDVNWASVERNCFSEWSHPADSELGVQIVKDLHRTGCSLFCGEDGQENQTLLKRVLLAYARWNKSVGYCQGFNMLAALILQVTDRNETDALKVMIYLIEGVLPESYFADSLRGLSIDMAVFRELLRTRLPNLSKHLDTLQKSARDGTSSYEPPLTNVFTMQWFLTLFSNCLPQPTVLRIWDLIMLEGNEILLRTALAIWQTLAERILNVRSADEFYCVMGVLTRQLLEFSLIEANALVKAIVTIGPLTELKSLREHYSYNISSWNTSVSPNIYNANVNKQLKVYPKERLVLDISVLKQQYAKLKQRQRQAHIIFNAAISRQHPSSAPPVAMNHLLLGKSALVPAQRFGPLKGSIPPARHTPTTLQWKDTPKGGESSSSSSDTELCDDPDPNDSSEDEARGGAAVAENDNLLSDNILAEDTVVDKDEKPDKIEQSLQNLDSIIANNTSQNVDSLLFDNVVGCTEATNSDIFDNSMPSTSVKDDIRLDLEEPEDDPSDFEQFLEDRVRCLKETTPPGDEKEDEENRIKYNRRNSARALQIIQENSVILHRIMQCQSRLSPSPTDEYYKLPGSSLGDVAVKDETSPIYSNFCDTSSSLLDESKIGELFSPLVDSLDTWVTKSSISDDPVQEIDMNLSIESPPEKSPEYGSRFSSILEKSKDLDEKYNNLILNSEHLKLEHTAINSVDSIGASSPTDTPAKYNFSQLDLEPFTTNKTTPALLDSALGSSTSCGDEYDFSEFSSAPPLVFEKDISLNKDKFVLDLRDDSPSSEFSNKSPNIEYTSYAQGKLDVSPKEDSAQKSPGKVFNPFPITLSSRQNKKVPLKLGLYKK